MAAVQKPDMVDPRCVRTIDDLLASKLAVNQQVDQMVSIFQKYGLAYFATITPSEMLCHPHNRANQMLSWVDMWDKGAKMLAIGMKRQFLGESIALEVSIDTTTRKKQFEANQKLIMESNGAMAPMTGQERHFVSINNCVPFFGLVPIACLVAWQPRFPEFVYQPHHCLLEGHQPWLHPRRATILEYSQR